MSGQKNPDELSTWKEIADYLEASVRTVQYWRQTLGMPVYLKGGRVTASRSELENWKSTVLTTPWGGVREHTPAAAPKDEVRAILKDSPHDQFETSSSETTTNVDITPTPTPGSAGSEKEFLSSWQRKFILAVVVAAVLSAAVWAIAHRTGQLVRMHEEGTLLKVFDDRNRLAWQFALPSAPNPDTVGYPRGIIADIDDDGQNEVLYVFWPPTSSGTLHCFRRDGTLAWKFQPGRAMSTPNGHVFDANYMISAIRVLKHPRPDQGRIVISSNHAWSWLQQVVILTANGRQVAEYWHPGWLPKLVLGDLDGDGKEEIILGGVNNAYRDLGFGATLVVLDPLRVTGQGPAPPGDDRQVRNVPVGQEAAVLLFPEIAKPSNPNDFYWVDRLYFVNGMLELRVGQPSEHLPYAHYQMDRSLHVSGVAPSPDLERLWASVLPPATPVAKRQAQISATLMNVKVLKNRFSAEPPNRANTVQR